MDNGSVSAPGVKRLPPQDQQKKNTSLGNNALLEAVVSWVTYDNFLAMKKLLAKYRHSLRNADGKIEDPLKELHPLLTLVSYDNENVTLDENVRKILHACLRLYMPKSSLYSPRKMKNDARLIKTLCEMGASVMAEDEEGCGPLEIALTEERLDLVETMMEFSSAKATECKAQGDTIFLILLKNYKPNMGDDYNKKFLNIIDKSISKGANLNQRDKHCKAPIHLTAKPSYVELLKKLINRGANLNLRTSGKDSVLMLACKSLNHKSNEYGADLKCIEWLVKHRGVDVNAKDNEGLSPLHYAAQNKDLSALMKILIKAGADIHAVTKGGANPLHLAIEKCNFEAMRYFIKRGVKFNRRNIVHGLTLMFMIFRDPNVHENPVEFLFRNGFDRSEEGDLTLLHLAAAFGYVEVIEKSIERGANVNCKDDVYQYTPLHLASMRCEFATVPALRKAGLIDGKVNSYRASVETLNGSMEIYFGCSHGINYGSTVLALLKAGADVHALDNRGCTPLHYASRHRQENDLIEILLRDGARVDDVDSEGLLPLHYSMLSENDKAMKHLLAFGADFNDVEHPRRNICDEAREFSSTGLRSHLIKLLFAGLPINHLYKPYYWGIVTHENAEGSMEYFRECDKLRNHMLTSRVSLYDWLRMNWKRRLTHIDSLPSNVEDKFRHYGIVIQSLREQTRNRKALIEPAKKAFELLTVWQWPDLCVEHVLSFLKNRTLRVLIDAAMELC